MDAFEPLPGLHVIGANTFGREYRRQCRHRHRAGKAYHISLHGKQARVINHLTGDQRVYLSFGQIWRHQAARFLAAHPDLVERACALGIPGHRSCTCNQTEWYSAFDVKLLATNIICRSDQRVHLGSFRRSGAFAENLVVDPQPRGVVEDLGLRHHQLVRLMLGDEGFDAGLHGFRAIPPGQATARFSRSPRCGDLRSMR